MSITRRMLEELTHLIRPVQNRIANTVGRAVVKLVNDTEGMQLVQVGILADETTPPTENFQQYGFASVPLEGAEGIALSPNGDRAATVVLCVSDRRHRPTGSVGGEVIMYTDEGDTIRLGRGNIVSVTSPDIRLGSATASDPVALKSDLDALKTYLDAHIHPAGSPNTGPPVSGAPTPTGAIKVKAE